MTNKIAFDTDYTLIPVVDPIPNLPGVKRNKKNRDWPDRKGKKGKDRAPTHRRDKYDFYC